MSEANAVAQAQLYLDVNRPGEAVKILTAALATNPENADALRTIARAHLAADSGWHGGDLAVRAATQAVTLSPHDALAWRILALGYSRLGRDTQAREVARTARSLAPDFWGSYTLVAEVDCSAKYLTRDTHQSVTEALRLAPNEPSVLFAAARVAQTAGHLKKARLLYEQVLAIRPDDAGARNNLAVVYSQSGNDGKAVAGFVSALSLDPQSALAIKNLRNTGLRILMVASAIVWCSTVTIGGLFINAQENLEDGNTSTPPDRLVPLITAAVTIAVLAIYFGVVRLKAGTAFGQIARNLPYADRFLTIWAAVVALCALGVVVATATSNEITSDIYGWVLLILAAYFGVVLCVAMVRRWR